MPSLSFPDIFQIARTPRHCDAKTSRGIFNIEQLHSVLGVHQNTKEFKKRRAIIDFPLVICYNEVKESTIILFKYKITDSRDNIVLRFDMSKHLQTSKPKRSETKFTPIQKYNGEPGQCYCKTLCSTRSCPCKRANIFCTNICHKYNTDCCNYPQENRLQK